MAKYWSEAVTFNTPQATSVLVINEAVFLARPTIAVVMVAKKPQASIAPPKAIALRMSHTVPIIPDMPELLSRSASIGLSLGIDISPYTLRIAVSYNG